MGSLSRLVRFGLVAAGVLLLSACSTVEQAYPGPKDFPVHGIDVSKYQGVIDWQAAAQGGVRFAYLKATEGGDRIDDQFQANWNGARAAGIPTGAYHFYYFCRPVEDQIAWFKTHVPPAPDALPPVLDMEWNHLSPTCKLRPPAAKIHVDMVKFLHAMEQFYGKKPIIYTTVDFHRQILTGELEDYPFWVRSVAGHPEKRYGNRSWAFWQYTATGSVPGVRGQVDRNAFAGSEKQWQDFLAQNITTGSVASN
ncbi:glycoside hydrolase [Labrys miyagiensis]